MAGTLPLPHFPNSPALGGASTRLCCQRRDSVSRSSIDTPANARLLTGCRDSFNQQPNFYLVREAQSDEDFWTASWLRSECYFEDQGSDRFVQSYKKKFSEQEFITLKRRCAGRYGNCLRCTCLLAVLNDGSSLLNRVIGTTDLSLRQALPGDDSRTLGIQTQPYGYIANVCVSRSHRRRGVASSLLESSVQVAKFWGLKRVYVHVDSGNKAARLVYHRQGFQSSNVTSSPSIRAHLAAAMPPRSRRNEIGRGCKFLAWRSSRFRQIRSEEFPAAPENSGWLFANAERRPGSIVSSTKFQCALNAFASSNISYALSELTRNGLWMEITIGLLSVVSASNRYSVPRET
ncbi:hypothetical protein SELMODRAFT_444359 [Selaginella moellendorffii]|uniref:N-acetyltransferase domain-containing protein n=1 Tax=Selaginella moellendorffii TaxID=88036 RepID=D8S9B0_SELML|nr:hypothetical protein SELMODRAFT_444359 [Selaginella moellendorffii]